MSGGFNVLAYVIFTIAGASSCYGKRGLSRMLLVLLHRPRPPIPVTGQGNVTAYSATKFGVRGLTQALGKYIYI